MYRYAISCPFQPKESGSTRLIKSQLYLFHQNQASLNLRNKRSQP
ncbi:unnamed protein product [Musa acuminata subsp. malaccensis]|nr:unnamed protein product [Musa acuminata subsp. malaccensis]